MIKKLTLAAAVTGSLATTSVADPQLCDPIATTAKGTIIARDNGTPLSSLQDYIAQTARGTQMYDPLMELVIKTYEGFPDATPEQAYESTYAQCIDSMN